MSSVRVQEHRLFNAIVFAANASIFDIHMKHNGKLGYWTVDEIDQMRRACRGVTVHGVQTSYGFSWPCNHSKRKGARMTNTLHLMISAVNRYRKKDPVRSPVYYLKIFMNGQLQLMGLSPYEELRSRQLLYCQTLLRRLIRSWPIAQRIDFVTTARVRNIGMSARVDLQPFIKCTPQPVSFTGGRLIRELMVNIANKEVRSWFAPDRDEVVQYFETNGVHISLFNNGKILLFGKHPQQIREDGVLLLEAALQAFLEKQGGAQEYA